jgi:hypothetical protein
MNKKKGRNFYLVSAIIWTVIALLVMYVLFFMSDANLMAQICGMVLICMCIIGQWMRYFKMK